MTMTPEECAENIFLYLFGDAADSERECEYIANRIHKLIDYARRVERERCAKIALLAGSEDVAKTIRDSGN